MNLIEELKYRHFIQDITAGGEEVLLNNNISFYIGFDPTSDSLHVGSLVPLCLMKHLQLHGHKPIALIGGATGMVGDPSGKSQERQLLDLDILRKNQQGIQKQIELFLNFASDIPNKAEIVNNYDWFQNMSFLNFIRDTGKLITVNYMMAKESVKKRIESEQGISFTEFTYQLIQGYDFLHLFEKHQCVMQIGGSDQWGNITTGTELIRKKTGKEAHAFTTPLLTKSDGGKFGKSESGNIWLDKNKTTPYQFYQFWLNASDDDAEKWIKIFTFLPQDEIEKHITEHKATPEKRMLQKILSSEITTLIHGKDELNKAIDASRLLFTEPNPESLKDLSRDAFMQVLPALDCRKISFQHYASLNTVDLLANTQICPSKGEAKKMIANGGVYMNKNKIAQPETSISDFPLLFDSYLLVQKGKKNFIVVEFTKD